MQIKIKKEKSKKINTCPKWLFIITYVILILYAIAVIVPYIWGFLSSVKSKIDFRYNLFGLPSEWLFSNYQLVLERFTLECIQENQTVIYTFMGMYINGFAYSFISALTHAITTYIMAYASTIKIKCAKIIDGIIIFTMFMPAYGTLQSEILMAKATGCYDSFFGVSFIMAISFTAGTWFFLIKSTITSLGKSYEEAACLDGATKLQILTRIYIPLTKNIISTFFLLTFVSRWNDYTTPYIMLPNYPTAALGLFRFSQSSSGDIAHVTIKLAACFLVALPVLILFIFFREKLMTKVSLSGGEKG